MSTANVIGLVLAFLALGYWLGGKLADARPQVTLLGGILLASAVTLTVVPFAARPLLHASLRGFDSLSAGIVIGSFVAVLTLFVLPVVLMGAVAPFALRLALPSVAESGQTAGRLYALSTAGSILGTFAAALFAIPLIGTQRTLLACAALLALAAAPLTPRAALAVVALAAGLAALPPSCSLSPRSVASGLTQAPASASPAPALPRKRSSSSCPRSSSQSGMAPRVAHAALHSALS